MPVHIENLETDVTVAAGDLPMSEAQVEKLVQIVLKRLQQEQRDQRRSHEATMLSPKATYYDPPGGDAGWD